MGNDMNKSEISRSDLQVNDKKYLTAFIAEILAAEQRILRAHNLADKKTNSVKLFKESILIRELFTHITQRLDLTICLSKEQYLVVKRIWYRALKTALSSSHNIQNISTIERIDSNMVNAVKKIQPSG